MNDFVQMDIFFFITSLVALVFLILLTVCGVYIVLWIKKIHTIISDLKEIIRFAKVHGENSIELIKNKIEHILDNAGWIEKSIIVSIATFIAKKTKKYGKIKKDVPKK